MRVCVTGAAGFIGQHVVKALIKSGVHVTGLDSRVTDDPKCDAWVKADITRSLPAGRYDVVIHLAAMANPRECDANPAQAMAVNVAGTYNVLRMALDSGARKVAFASSAHVYGISPKYLPTDENHPLWLQNAYTASKILGEQLCSLFYENHGLAYTTLRLYNAYGPGQSRGYFIPDMIARAKDGAISLSGGDTTKDFVFVGDVAEAFALAAETSFVGAINIGTGAETKLSWIAGWITDGGATTVIVQTVGGATRMCADIGRARRILKWEPQVRIAEGLNACLKAEGRPVPA